MHTRGLNVHAEVSVTVRQKSLRFISKGKNVYYFVQECFVREV